MLEELMIAWRDSYVSNRMVSTMRREFRPHNKQTL